MTPEQKVGWLILIRAAEWREVTLPEITKDNIDDICQEWRSEDEWGDAAYEVREGEVEIDIPCRESRYYESKSVGGQAPDGSWVGWTHWYGGGKHGEPESVPWIKDAYHLDCVEEERMVTVRTFSRG
jgi:hypothetical protein